MSAQTIADRTDIHRSCKALEAVVNVLNDYCEAATAIVAIQKKLAKALRDAAYSRSLSEIAANALSASATIFEAVSDVDTKFAKLTDKECDNVSADVKKWFKKLAKEERAHDERVANANYKIKQAGQMYERKVKKNPEDAAEEHGRYIGVLSSLGPEITQEKHNHALFVSQRHADTMFGVAACMARVADAEWLRACEEVRRMAPSVGSVGEWRALCEGSWRSAPPIDLPDVDVKQEPVDAPPNIRHRQSQQIITNATANGRPGELSPQGARPKSDYSSRAVTPTGTPQPPHSVPVAAAADSPAAAVTEMKDFAPDDDGRDRSYSVNSIASLGSFPAPPDHFPLPPVAALKPPQEPEREIEEPATPMREAAESPETFATPKSSMDTTREERVPLTLVPISTLTPQREQHPDDTFLDLGSPTSSPSNAASAAGRSFDTISMPTSKDSRSEEVIPFSYTRPQPQTESASHTSSTRTSEHTQTPRATATPPPLHSAHRAASPRVPSGPRSSMLFKKGDYVENTDIGSRRPLPTPGVDPPQPATSPPTSQSLERTDTSRSINGNVATREKFARTTAPASPPPSDVPRLPMSVSALASRYDVPGEPSSASAPASPSPAATSPANPMPQLQSPSSATRNSDASRLSPIPAGNGAYNALNATAHTPHDRSPSPLTEELNRRKQRLQELEELDLREQEYHLRLKEREIEQKARQLESERMRLMSARGMLTAGQAAGAVEEYESDNSFQHGRNVNSSGSGGGSGGVSGSGGLRIPRTDSPTNSPALQNRHPYASSSSTQLPLAPARPGRSPHRYASQQSLISPSPSQSQAYPASHVQAHARPSHKPQLSISQSQVQSQSQSQSHSQASPVRAPPSPSTPTTHGLTSKPEKPKGWIRRLSMPVMAGAFSSDAKAQKGISNTSYSPTGPMVNAGYRGSHAYPDEEGRIGSESPGKYRGGVANGGRR